MSRIEIEKAIKYQGEVEIKYKKTDGNISIRHIFDMDYSDKFGEDYIEAYCREKEGYLTFSVKWIWTEIYDLDDTAPKTGLYVFACRYDNHIEFEMYRLNEKEKLWKYFTEKYEHHDGYFCVIPLAYHYIDYYSNGGYFWKMRQPFAKEESSEKIGIWAYKKNVGDIEYALQCFSSSIWPEYVFLNRDFGTDYDEEYWKDFNFIGYYQIPRYTETHHAAHCYTR